MPYASQWMFTFPTYCRSWPPPAPRAPRPRRPRSPLPPAGRRDEDAEDPPGTPTGTTGTGTRLWQCLEIRLCRRITIGGGLDWQINKLQSYICWTHGLASERTSGILSLFCATYAFPQNQVSFQFRRCGVGCSVSLHGYSLKLKDT